MGLICFQRSGGEPVPGCTGKTQNLIKTDYCIEDPAIANAATYPPTFSPTFAPSVSATDLTNDERDLVATLTLVGQDGEPAASYPLQLCEGDCDSDDDVSDICYV